jgi:hypothetical protein
MCCAWPRATDVDEQIREFSFAVTDWTRFEQLTHHHRVRPLVQDAIRRTGIEPPPRIFANLQSAALSTSARALTMARETVRLSGLLCARGLDPMVIKGAALTNLCYPSLALKESWDIDLLVKANEADLARVALNEAGYTVMNPALTREQFARFIPLSKEIEFSNPENGITVELHWQLLNAGTKLNSTLCSSARQQVILPFGTIQTLDDERLFSYLCLHGATHNWFRLKWLADLNAFVERFPQDARNKLIESSRNYGADRSAAVAMALCGQLFKLDSPDNCSRPLPEDPVGRLMVRNAVKTFSFRGALEGREAEGSLWRRSIFASFVATPGLAHMKDAASYYWRSAGDNAAIALPRKLQFLYHFMRVPLWLGRLSKRFVARKPRSG